MNDENKKEDLYFMKKDIWKRSFKFGIRVIKMTQKLPNENTTWVLNKQIIRSATSISANIAEGSGGSSKKEFIHYQNIARKSALETYNWLLFIEEIFSLEERIKTLKQECLEIIKILTTIVLNAKQNN